MKILTNFTDLPAIGMFVAHVTHLVRGFEEYILTTGAVGKFELRFAIIEVAYCIKLYLFLYEYLNLMNYTRGLWYGKFHKCISSL